MTATEKLQNACKHFIGDAIGAEKTEEVKKLKESGATGEGEK